MALPRGQSEAEPSVGFFGQSVAMPIQTFHQHWARYTGQSWSLLQALREGRCDSVNQLRVGVQLKLPQRDRS